MQPIKNIKYTELFYNISVLLFMEVITRMCIQITSMYVFYKLFTSCLPVFYVPLPPFPSRRGDTSCAIRTAASIVIFRYTTMRRAHPATQFQVHNGSFIFCKNLQKTYGPSFLVCTNGKNCAMLSISKIESSIQFWGDTYIHIVYAQIQKERKGNATRAGF